MNIALSYQDPALGVPRTLNKIPCVGYHLGIPLAFSLNLESFPMDRVTPALASLFSESGVAESWTKLDDSHKYSRFCHKYWGESIEDEAKRWRSSEPTVENNLANEIGPNCYGLDLDMRFKCSKMWVRQDYIRIYEYCEKQHREGPSSAEERARSVVVTGQPGIGALLSSVVSNSLSNTPSREKARRTGSRMQSAVVLEKKNLFFGT